MAEITKYKSVAMTEMFSRIQQVQENPTLMFRSIIDTFDEVTGGEYELVDPTNPTVFLLSTSCVMAAANMQESITNLRKQYPELAQTQEDLYHHMSDSDYIGRFATAASTKARLVLQWSQLKSNMVQSADGASIKAVVPRDTTITVDGITFMMQYPVEIKYFNNGVLTVSYDTEIGTPLFNLSTNEIQYRVTQDSGGTDWLMFDVDVLQCHAVVSEEVVQKSKRINLDVSISDPFYAVRGFYKDPSDSTKWLEMHISHSDLVYDPFKPTVCVKVFDDRVNLQIPTVYQQTSLLEGIVRFYVYTTKGAVAYNFTDYGIDLFSVNLQALDEQRDMTIYSSVLARVSIHGTISQTVTGGSDPIGFSKLRERMINNSTGVPEIPITPAQAQTVVETHGFELVRFVDTITDRVFLATRKLPDPSDKRLLTAANVGLSTLITTLAAVQNHPHIRVNGKRWTLLSSALYRQDNGIVQVVQPYEHDSLRNMAADELVSNLNSKMYLYSPFHYVLDSSNPEFTTRAYYLDNPKADNINFVRQNQTLQLAVNTGSYYIEKVATGWRLLVTTQSGTFYKQMTDSQVSAQLAFYPSAQNSLAYITAKQVGMTEGGERIFAFDLSTDFDIDDKHCVRIANARIPGVSSYDVRCAIDGMVQIFYTTNSLTPNYKADESDGLIAKDFLPTGSVAVTAETLQVTLGLSLDNLWTRTRTLPLGVTYKRYTQNIPKVYKEDVYDIDPVTGSMFDVIDGRLVYNRLHSRGEVVYDADNNVVYEHKVGDVELDREGNPIVLPLGQETKEVDMVFVDAKHIFASDPAFVDYSQEFAQVIAEWVTQDLSDIQKVLLEQTRIYFYPKNHLNVIDVNLSDNQTARLNAEQSFVIELDVGIGVYQNTQVRQQLQDKTVSLLDKLISGTEVNIVAIKSGLQQLYGNSVLSFNITGLGGEMNLRYLTLKSSQDRLCLKRKMVLQPDGSTILKEDVTFNFHLVD